MFCPHKSVLPTANKDEMVCLGCWRLFKNLGEMTSELSNQVSVFSAALRLLPWGEAVRVEYRDGLLYLNDQPQALCGPETELAAAQVWGDIAREFAQEAELLAERSEG